MKLNTLWTFLVGASWILFHLLGEAMSTNRNNKYGRAARINNTVVSKFDPMKCFPKALCGLSCENSILLKKRNKGLINDYVQILDILKANPILQEEILTKKAPIQTSQSSEDEDEENDFQDASYEYSDEYEDDVDSGERYSSPKKNPYYGLPLSYQRRKVIEGQGSTSKGASSSLKRNAIREKYHIANLMKQDERLGYGLFKKDKSFLSKRFFPERRNRSGTFMKKNGLPVTSQSKESDSENSSSESVSKNQILFPIGTTATYYDYLPKRRARNPLMRLLRYLRSPSYQEEGRAAGSKYADFIAAANRQLEKVYSNTLKRHKEIASKRRLIKEILRTAVSIGREFEEPTMCNELFNGCPLKYNEVLNIVGKVRRTLRGQERTSLSSSLVPDPEALFWSEFFEKERFRILEKRSNQKVEENSSKANKRNKKKLSYWHPHPLQKFDTSGFFPEIGKQQHWRGGRGAEMRPNFEEGNKVSSGSLLKNFLRWWIK